jgi:hypothetical protein
LYQKSASLLKLISLTVTNAHDYLPSYFGSIWVEAERRDFKILPGGILFWGAGFPSTIFLTRKIQLQSNSDKTAMFGPTDFAVLSEFPFYPSLSFLS